MSNYKEYTINVWPDGTKTWYLNGKRHREGGPAIEHTDGTKTWYLNDKCHREDGPAVEWANGDKHWYLNGKLYREDGPPIEFADGTKYWYLSGKYLTEEEFNERMNNTCINKTITIEGVEYKLVPTSKESKIKPSSVS